MKKVLGIIIVTTLLILLMPFCGACSSESETTSDPGTSLENVEEITLPEVGWFTVL
ncbi:hypothetical protein [Butyrivibrio sp. NC2002]|uniref:hypothetical protein n=1 Tax=Butyrivibrio sp. NC2002 TaxID=1410610 RepID=UPI000AEA457D|nr:hypothetical protein [Butyrivibrio sp. NC2002]